MTDGSAPQVDVIIAAWGAESTIARAVRSALAQDAVARVIVVDDASRDATAEVAASCDLGDGRLVILRQPKNAGPSAARNRAIAESKADWIAILDADDLMQPGRIAGLIAHAANTDMIADDLLVVDEGAEDAAPRLMLGEALTPKGEIDLVTFVGGNVAHHRDERAELGFIKPLIRRTFLDTNNLRYGEDLRLGEDYDLYTRALACGARLRIIAAQGYIYVQRENSLSGLHSEEDLLRLREADRRLGELPGLSAEERAALRDHYQSVDCRLQWRRVISATKARDLSAFLSAFTQSPRVSFYLAGKLWEQFFVRSVKRVSTLAIMTSSVQAHGPDL